MSDYFTANLQQNALLKIEKGLHRSRQVVVSSNYSINFSSNDYLSLTSDERVSMAYQDGFSKNPVGSGGSVVVCGYHAAHIELEQAFKEALLVDDCLLFSSGYVANLSVMSLMAELNSPLLIDKAAHASIYDGLKLSGAKYNRYLHNDLRDLEKKLTSLADSNDSLIIITESMFSMSGQRAPLLKISQLMNSKSMGLIVDEAHAFGVLGPEGLGGVMKEGLTQHEVPLRIIPFGKAMGGFGAVVAGQKFWIDALLQTRPAVYSTAISPAYAYGLHKTLDILRRADDRREKLFDLITYFQKSILQSPLKWRDSSSPIQQLQLGCPHLATKFANYLKEKSILCLPMRQPTVNKEETGLRVILNYKHERSHIDSLFKHLHACNN